MDHLELTEDESMYLEVLLNRMIGTGQLIGVEEGENQAQPILKKLEDLVYEV